MYLSVIIPAYNEEKRLAKTLAEIDEYLREQSYDYEILVVNDGSTDKTAEVVREQVLVIRNLRLIDNKENHGKGFVVRQGMLKAKGDFRVFTDADNSTSIDHLEKMLPAFKKGFEVVIGTRDPRDAKGACQLVPQSWLRRRLGDIFNLIVKIVTGLWGFWDTQCGFKGFGAEAAKEIFSRTKIDKFAFDVEVLVLAKKLGLKIKKIPIFWKNDPESKVKFKSMVSMLFEVFQIKLNLIKGVYGKT